MPKTFLLSALALFEHPEGTAMKILDQVMPVEVESVQGSAAVASLSIKILKGNTISMWQTIICYDQTSPEYASSSLYLLIIK